MNKKTKINQIYKCNICGNIIEVLHSGVGQLVCCNQEMELLIPKTKDIGNEKHLPVITRTNTDIKVKVGSISHPMEEDHYIEYVEIISEDGLCRQSLKPGDKAEINLKVKKNDKVRARAYCNIHGLWGTE